MTRHHLGLRDAAVLATRHLLLTAQAVSDVLLTAQAVSDVLESEAIGAIVGPAGVGKTFAIDHATDSLPEPVIRLTFEARPTMRLIADRLLHALTGAPGRGSRFAMTDQLLTRLSERRRLIVVREAQNLNRDCFEYLATSTTTRRPGSRCSSTAAMAAGRSSPASRCSAPGSTAASHSRRSATATCSP